MPKSQILKDNYEEAEREEVCRVLRQLQNLGTNCKVVLHIEKGTITRLVTEASQLIAKKVRQGD